MGSLSLVGCWLLLFLGWRQDATDLFDRCFACHSFLHGCILKANHFLAEGCIESSFQITVAQSIADIFRDGHDLEYASDSQVAGAFADGAVDDLVAILNLAASSIELGTFG